jgi:hypothetical protein
MGMRVNSEKGKIVFCILFKHLLLGELTVVVLSYAVSIKTAALGDGMVAVDCMRIGRETEVLRENLAQCHLVYHRSNMTCS